MKTLKVFVFVLFLFAIRYTLYASLAYAQDCTDTNDPEFHSLRPYPGKPCVDAVSETATFCGDSLSLTDNIKITYNPGTDNCVSIPGGKVRCTYSVPKNRNITIGLSEAELPIMGNTEDVTPNASPDMPDAQKVNEYVSWYLNGVINRAEYPFLDMSKNCIGETTQRAGVCLNTDALLGLCLSPNPIPLLPDIPNLLLTADGINSCGGGKKSCCVTINPLVRKVDILDRDKLINYSGPIRKLLPQRIQNDTREKQVNDAGVVRHNQIVACTYGINIPIPFLNLQIGAIPGPCVNLGIFASLFQKKRRILDWQGHIPPKREEYNNYNDYYQAYRAWRGDKCLSFKIPLTEIELMLCFDNPLHPNFYGDLYPYIPFSSTEDRKGEVTASGSVGSTPGVTINNVSTSFTNATLYFAHMQEASEAASILQDTFVYKGADKFAAGNSVPVNTAGSCKIVDVRSGPGDSLLPAPTSITGNIAYTATFTCDFDPPTCSGKPLPPNNRFCETEYSGSCVPSSWTCKATISNAGCPSGYKCGYDCSCDNPATQTCTKAIPITIATTTKTPLADKIWAQLVSGTSSVFRRIFPKLGSGSQIGEVKDIPASTKVTYSGDVSGTGDLNFPHIGGISEYFLKGIQTMLRPKGYGESISFGETTSTAICGDIPDLPAGSGACKLTSTTINGISLPPTMVSILEAAAQTYNVPPGLVLGVMFGEGIFNPGKYDWTEDNVQTWSCSSIPNCSGPSTSIVDLTGWSTLANQILPDLQRIDPNKSEADPCNLLDAVFALTKNLHGNAGGSSALTGKSCLNQTMTSTYPTSCTWNGSQYETSIRVWEFGTQWGNTSYGFLTCATKQNSCSTGGGIAAQCPTDTISNTDTCDNSSNVNSHNACVWDVARSH